MPEVTQLLSKGSLDLEAELAAKKAELDGRKEIQLQEANSIICTQK